MVCEGAGKAGSVELTPSDVCGEVAVQVEEEEEEAGCGRDKRVEVALSWLRQFGQDSRVVVAREGESEEGQVPEKSMTCDWEEVESVVK